MRENNYFLIPFEFCNECEHMLSVNFLYNVSCIECYNLAFRIFIRLDFVWEHFVDYNSFAYNTPTSTRIPLNMPVSHALHRLLSGGGQTSWGGENRDLSRKNVLCGDVTYPTCSLSRYPFHNCLPKNHRICCQTRYMRNYIKKFTDNICYIDGTITDGRDLPALFLSLSHTHKHTHTHTHTVALVFDCWECAGVFFFFFSFLSLHYLLSYLEACCLAVSLSSNSLSSIMGNLFQFYYFQCLAKKCNNF